MHTGEPRPLLNRDDNETYDWIIGKSLQQHMILAETDQPNKFVLALNPFILIHDLREGVFGSNGYFKELQTSNELKTKYCECLKEMGSYEIKLTE